VAANLKAIGWSGDVHVPKCNFDVAAKVGKMTRDAGLEVASYCSYYFAGFSEEKGVDFNKVFAAATALTAPSIRVWPGNKGSKETDSQEFNKVVLDTRRIADI